MVLQVSDASSHRDVQIANFADVLVDAPARQQVFNAVYWGKKSFKTVKEVAAATPPYSPKRVTEIAKHLVRHNLFLQDKKRIDGKNQTIYVKIEFIASNKTRILRLAQSKSKIKKFRQKTSPMVTVRTPRITLRFPSKIKIQVATRFITIDEVKEFARVKEVANVPETLSPERLPERVVKNAFIELLGEEVIPKDWPGETSDILSTRLTLGGRRRRAAFALKGPAKKGPLVPGMMGKNGDQLQRLFDSPADVFFVQYEGEIKQNTIRAMQEFARARAILASEVLWGAIDRKDTYRLRLAYPKAFASSDP